MSKPLRPDVPLHPVMEEFLGFLELRGKAQTARTTTQALRQFLGWTNHHGIDPMTVTAPQGADFLAYLATEYRSPNGALLARTTLSTRLAGVKSWYAWLAIRNRILTDPLRRLRVHVPRSRVVVKEHLTLQEATALVQTAAGIVATGGTGPHHRAVALRNLALVCIAIASGRRIGGLCTLKAEHIDLDRGEIRVEHEKGHVGRVLPLAGWAVAVVKRYLDDARPLLVAEQAPWLFLDAHGTASITQKGLRWILSVLIERTIRDNPDLSELPAKRVCWHSLRVTNAVLLFANGCDIRSVNELLLHRSLSTTARYTPIDVEDLRQILHTAHPRA